MNVTRAAPHLALLEDWLEVLAPTVDHRRLGDDHQGPYRVRAHIERPPPQLVAAARLGPRHRPRLRLVSPSGWCWEIIGWRPSAPSILTFDCEETIAAMDVIVVADHVRVGYANKKETA